MKSYGLKDLMNFGDDEFDLSKVDFTAELLSCVPRHAALHYRVLPVFQNPDGALGVAFSGPPDLDMLDGLTHLLKRQIHLRAANAQALDGLIRRLYGPDAGRGR